MTRRLLLSYLALVLAVLALLEVPLGISNARSERQDLTAKVERDADAFASLAEGTLEHRAKTAPVKLVALAAHYRRDTGGRVVVVDTRGVALLDSQPTAPEDRFFRTRPEVAQALAGNVATGVRHSETLGHDLLYVAVPVASGGRVHGAVRITYPTSAIDRRVRRYWLTLAAVAAVVLAATGLVGLALARSATRPLRLVEDAADQASGGDLQARAPLEGPEEIRRLATSFNELVATLDRLLRSQQAFVADASHQLRTPLTSLRLRIENLEHGLAPDDRVELDRAVVELERLARLVDGLLALARADSAQPQPASLDLAAIVRERIDAWTPLAAEQQVELQPELTGPLTVQATPGRLEQILDNLLANALEVAPTGSSILVAARPSRDGVELHVIDHGPGMTPEQRRRAFDRFWRGDGSPGHGLGLAIVQGLATGDGGEVELLDAPDGGLDAVVRLRAGAAEPHR